MTVCRGSGFRHTVGQLRRPEYLVSPDDDFGMDDADFDIYREIVSALTPQLNRWAFDQTSD